MSPTAASSRLYVAATRCRSVARLASDHDDLTAVMSLMRHEVGEHMVHVEGQVAPYVPLGRRHLALGREAQLEQRLDPVATAFQGRDQFPPRDASIIDPQRSGDTV